MLRKHHAYSFLENLFLAFNWIFLTKYINRNSNVKFVHLYLLLKQICESNDFVIFLENIAFWAYLFRIGLNGTFYRSAHWDLFSETVFNSLSAVLTLSAMKNNNDLQFFNIRYILDHVISCSCKSRKTERIK